MVRTNWIAVSGALVVALVVCVSVVRSAEEKSTAAPSAADKQQMMKMMMEMGKPGPEHERLKAYAGDWDADVSMNCPDNSVQKSKGVMHIKPIMGDRYIQLNYEGEMVMPDGKPMPFKGMGIGGYDKAKKKYTNVWLDEMSTGMLLTEGTADGNVITMEGQSLDPASGQPMKVKEVITETDASHHKYELHMSNPGTDGKLMKVLEIQYTKKS